MSKVTMQDIANALSTSRISVWKALNNRPGVSDELRAEIRRKAEEMDYFKAAEYTPEAEPQPTRTVAAAVSRPESSLFWMQIIHQLAKELSRNNVNLLYTYLPTHSKEDFALPATLIDGAVSGMIVLNVYDEALLRRLAALPLAKVFLDTMPAVPYCQLNGDLVMIEGRDAVRQITEKLLATGRTRLGFVGDTGYAQTNTDRYNGFCDALAAHGLAPRPAWNLTGPLGLRTHYEEISRFLDSLPQLPQAFVCASDYIAHFICRYCTEHEIPPEKTPVLTGFDNNFEYGNVAGQISTVDVDTKAIGARLANKILFAIDHPLAMHETSYTSTQVLYRGELAE